MIKCDLVFGKGHLSNGQQLCSKCYGAIRERNNLSQQNISLSRDFDVNMNDDVVDPPKHEGH